MAGTHAAAVGTHAPEAGMRAAGTGTHAAVGGTHAGLAGTRAGGSGTHASRAGRAPMVLGRGPFVTNDHLIRHCVAAREHAAVRVMCRRRRMHMSAWITSREQAGQRRFSLQHVVEPLEALQDELDGLTTSQISHSSHATSGVRAWRRPVRDERLPLT